MKLCDSVTGSLNRTPSFNLKMFRKSVDESNSEESRKIRRHTPVGSGEYSVGCWDMMCGGPTEKGSFFRLFYPVEKTDIYVSVNCCEFYTPVKVFNLYNKRLFTRLNSFVEMILSLFCF